MKSCANLFFIMRENPDERERVQPCTLVIGQGGPTREQVGPEKQVLPEKKLFGALGERMLTAWCRPRIAPGSTSVGLTHPLLFGIQRVDELTIGREARLLQGPRT